MEVKCSYQKSVRPGDCLSVKVVGNSPFDGLTLDVLYDFDDAASAVFLYDRLLEELCGECEDFFDAYLRL